MFMPMPTEKKSSPKKIDQILKDLELNFLGEKVNLLDKVLIWKCLPRFVQLYTF